LLTPAQLKIPYLSSSDSDAALVRVISREGSCGAPSHQQVRAEQARNVCSFAAHKPRCTIRFMCKSRNLRALAPPHEVFVAQAAQPSSSRPHAFSLESASKAHHYIYRPKRNELSMQRTNHHCTGRCRGGRPEKAEFTRKTDST
jgi:hypothetical protein